MSTIDVDNIQDSNGDSLDTTYVTNGSAKAWCSFDGVSGNTILGSLNVSSVTDDGTGQYTNNFTNDFADTGYAASLAPGDSKGEGHRFSVYAVGSCRVFFFDVGTSNNEDVDRSMIICMGDLA